MEDFAKTILSEEGIVALLFFFLLAGVIWALKWFWAQYINLTKEHNLAFLKSFDRIVGKVGDLADGVVQGNNNHSKEHKDIGKFLDEKRVENMKQHEVMINQIKENNDNIKLTHESVKDLHNLISTK